MPSDSASAAIEAEVEEEVVGVVETSIVDLHEETRDLLLGMLDEIAMTTVGHHRGATSIHTSQKAVAATADHGLLHLTEDGQPQDRGPHPEK